MPKMLSYRQHRNVYSMVSRKSYTLQQTVFLDLEESVSTTTVVVLGVVTHFQQLPKALLVRNGKLRNFAYTFVTSFPRDQPSSIFY